MNNWSVDTTEHFAAWLKAQDDEMIEDVLASLEVLKIFGPHLGRPDVDTIIGSQYANMKELRVQSNGGPVRAFFAFDPRRKGIVLCAGDKTGINQKRFYRSMIKLADQEYSKHLRGIIHA